MPTAATAKPTLAARISGRRRSSRRRRLRTLGAAGFAGVSVALLASQHAGQAPPPPPRFAAEPLVGGLVTVPVRFADAGAADYLRPGDRIDVLAARESGAGPAPTVPDALSGSPPEGETVAAADVSVLEIAHPAVSASLSRASPDDGGLVFLAVDNATAARLARAAVSSRLSYALRHT